jgi:cytosine/adenosine deaminase-related metal-dependent hydrolase
MDEPARLDSTPQEIADQLRQSEGDPRRRILIRGATVLTLESSTPDLTCGDIYIHGSRIHEVRPHTPDYTPPDGTIVVPAEGCIALPGLQDTHRHSWQAQLRRMLAGVDLDEYIEVILGIISPHYRPEDIYAATILSDLGAINTGITTVMDFAHNTRTPDHGTASLEAHGKSGIRHVVAIAPMLTGEREKQWPENVTRMVAEGGYGSGSLGTLRLGVFGSPDLAPQQFVLSPENIALARDLGLSIIADATFGSAAAATITELGQGGHLGPDVTLIHCTALDDTAWRWIADTGTRVSVSTTSDAEIGIHGANPPIQRALAQGIRFGLGVDVECSLSSDLFAQMRATYTIQRMQAFAARYRGAEEPGPVNCGRIVEMATADGAATNGLSTVTGALAAGKAADIVVVNATDLNNIPLNNAYATIVLGADSSSVRDVFVGGNVRKWHGEVLGVDLTRLTAMVNNSRDYLLDRSDRAMNLFD